MNTLNFLDQINSIIWGVPLMVLLVGCGFFLTVRLAGIQLFGFKQGIDILRGNYDNPNDPGEVSHFRALSTALSATIGTGNIVGVAAAILMGGPGAVFWMWITALVGMATKFSSCTLAVHFRRIDDRGVAHAGPMHYIELGLGKKFKWLAVLFAIFTTFASFGAGNMFQVNNMVSSFNGLIAGEGTEILGVVKISVGIFVAALTAMVILGGIKRIAIVASILVPFMCIFYILGGLLILLKNYELIIPGFELIFYQAFNAPESVAGGLFGGVIRSGVARGLFSNEAGLGSAAMAHGAAKTKEPVREGLVAMLGPFIDTIVVCSITALVIICTGAYETMTVKGQLTSAAFNLGLPGSGTLVFIGTILFAFSSLIAWSYYGDRAVDYLFGEQYVVWYRWFYVLIVFVGAVFKIDEIISFSDIMNGLMAIPNLLALIVLSPVLVKLTNDYMDKQKN